MQIIPRSKVKKMLLKAGMLVFCLLIIAFVYNVNGRPASLKQDLGQHVEQNAVIKDNDENSKNNVIGDSIDDKDDIHGKSEDVQPPVPLPKELSDTKEKLKHPVHAAPGGVLLMNQGHEKNELKHDDGKDDEYDDEDEKNQEGKGKHDNQEEDDKEPLPDDDQDDDEDIRVKLHVDDTKLRHRSDDEDEDKPLKLSELEPMDHLEGVHMEQDGHLNRDYKKEIFLGNHEEFEQGTEEEIKKKLEDIFFKVDEDKEGHIEQKELEEWIQLKVQEHFDEAKEENEKIFTTLDTDGDGHISWKEFHIQFLVAKGHPENKAEKHAEDYETIPLEAEEKEHLIRFKFRWAEADEDPQDNKLDKEEFRSFRHPEQSRNTLIRMVQDIIDNLDKNGDGILTEEEFIALPPGDVDSEWEKADKIWQDERRKEFHDVIDSDRDGNVTKEELARYVDPKNPNHAVVEARNLIQLADNNKDGRLSLQEVLDNTQLFLGSKMVDTGRSFHDEF